MKVVILAICIIQWLFTGDIPAKFRIPNLSQSPDIVQNSHKAIYDFLIPGQSLVNKNCCNSRTSNDIDVKLGPVTKLDKRNNATSKNLMMMSCWQMLTNFCLMTNLEQSGSWIPDARSVKFTFSLIVTFILQKLEIDLNNFYHSSHTIAFSKDAVFFQKILIFCKKKATISKIKGVVVVKAIFSKTTYLCVLNYVLNFRFLA